MCSAYKTGNLKQRNQFGTGVIVPYRMSILQKSDKLLKHCIFYGFPL